MHARLPMEEPAPMTEPPRPYIVYRTQWGDCVRDSRNKKGTFLLFLRMNFTAPLSHFYVIHFLRIHFNAPLNHFFVIESVRQVIPIKITSVSHETALLTTMILPYNLTALYVSLVVTTSNLQNQSSCLTYFYNQ